MLRTTKPRGLIGKIRELVYTTPIEIAALATIGAVGAGIVVHGAESRRELFQPVSYSEYEQLEDAERRGDIALNAYTKYLYSVNDFTNKHFEAHNTASWWDALSRSSRQQWFAKKLDEAIDTTARVYRRNITDFAIEIPVLARASLKELDDVNKAGVASGMVGEALDNSWNYSYYDDTHTETDCTGTGKDRTCTTRTVCDRRHHTWTYNAEQAIQANRALTETRIATPTVGKLVIPVPEKTNAWNEREIRKAFEREHGRRPNDKELLEKARLFRNGSRYLTTIDDIREGYERLIGADRETLLNDFRSAKTAHETTLLCMGTSGPREYENARVIEDRAKSVAYQSRNIIEPIVAMTRDAKTILETDKKFILAARPTWKAHHPDIDPSTITESPRALESKVMSMTRKAYRDHFPEGNPTTEYRGWVTLLGTLGGALVFGLVGLGIDRTIGGGPTLSRYSSRYSRRF